MGIIATLLLVTALAGVASTGIGGLVGALLQKNSNKIPQTGEHSLALPAVRKQAAVS